MKKGEIYSGIVEKLEFPDRGILHIDGEKVVVKHVLPGQEIEFAVTKKRNGKWEGRSRLVLQPSPAELFAPACPHAGVCGGCSYQSLPYEEQLRIKEGQVKELLDGVCSDYEFEGIAGSPQTSMYRNKMEFSFGDEVKGGPLSLGMHRKGSYYDIVTVDQCQLVHGDCLLILRATLDCFKEFPADFYKKIAHIGYLRHLLVRRAVKTGEILAALVTTTQTDSIVRGGRAEEELLAGWRDRLLALPIEGKYAGILHTKNDSLADVVQSDETVTLYGTDYFYEELLNLKFKITPFSFFQTNSLGAEVLYETARGYIGDTKDKRVFDLYSGTGTIAQILAPVASHVTGVEIVGEAVEAARENAKQNGLTNCDFIAGDVLKVLDTLTEEPDLIVLDPPRDGINPKALKRIIAYGVERIVYISCKPTSLTRDLVVLQSEGYEVKRARCVDLFPGTCHCEVCVEICRKQE